METNKRLKFRLWFENIKKMIYSDTFALLNYNDGTLFYSEIPIVEPNTFDNLQKKIIMQWTGLLDCNKRDIYEGDILKNDNNIAIIKFGEYKANNNNSYLNEDAYGFYLEYLSHKGVIDNATNVDVWEIISNVYENIDIEI